MLDTLLHQPLYVQLNFWILISTVSAVTLLCCVPSKAKEHAGALFFPQLPDKFLTLLYLLLTGGLYTYGYYTSLFPTEAESEAASSPWLDVLAPLILFFPLLVRYIQRQGLGFPFAAKHFYHLFLTLAVIFLFSISFVLTGAAQWIMETTGTPEMQEAVKSFKETPVALRMYGIISAVVIAPIVEEIFFRGFIFNTLRVSTGAFAAALFSGLFFGAIHLSLLQTCILSFFGMMQCYLYMRTSSIIYPILLHMAFNAIGVARIIYS